MFKKIYVSLFCYMYKQCDIQGTNKAFEIVTMQALIRGVITTKATKAAALVDFWDHNM